jgi:peptidoglycan/LPS O-acetylase OafA/YrhL
MSKSVSTAPVEFIQSLRGFALLAVIGIHTARFFTQSTQTSFLTYILVYIVVSLIVAVPLFVWISGFVMALQYSCSINLRAYYRKRGSAVIPPYLIFSLFYIFFSAYQPQAASWSFPDLQTILILLLTGSSYSHLWFILLLVQFYLLFPLFCIPKLRSSLIQYSFIWFLLAFIVQSAWHIFIPSLASYYFLKHSFGSQIILLISRSFPAYLGFFLIGIVMGSRYKNQTLRILKMKTVLLPWIILVLVALSIISIQWIQGIEKYGSFYGITEAHRLQEKILYPFVYLSMILLSLKLFSSSKINYKLKKLLVRLGDRSFGIYLLHAGVLIVLANLLKMNGITPNHAVFYILLFTGTIILSLLAEEIISRIPVLSKMLGRKVKSPSLFPAPFPKSAPKSCE